MARNRPPLMIAVLGSALAVALGSTAAYAGRDSISVSFFAHHDSSAHWTDQASNDGDQWSMELDVSPTGFAGIQLNHVPTAPPADPPAFDFKADKVAASGGSPRLVMVFSDGGDMELRPLTWTTTWTHEDGSSTDWDIHSPTCPFLFENTYAVGLACHTGATVTGAFLVSDSGWLSGQYVNWIDNLSYGSTVISQPSDNSSS